MTSLALDLGQTVGWVIGGTTGVVEGGEFSMPDSRDLGFWLAGADAEFPQLMRGCDSIAVEQPFLSSGGKKKDGTPKPGGYYPARKLLGLLGHVYYHAHYLGISSDKIEEVPVSTGKLTLAGHGQADKDMMIAAACEWYGWDPEDVGEHQADAGGILKVHLFGAQTSGRRRPVRSGAARSIILKGDRR